MMPASLCRWNWNTVQCDIDERFSLGYYFCCKVILVKDDAVIWYNWQISFLIINDPAHRQVGSKPTIGYFIIISVYFVSKYAFSVMLGRFILNLLSLHFSLQPDPFDDVIAYSVFGNSKMLCWNMFQLLLIANEYILPSPAFFHHL